MFDDYETPSNIRNNSHNISHSHEKCVKRARATAERVGELAAQAQGPEFGDTSIMVGVLLAVSLVLHSLRDPVSRE